MKKVLVLEDESSIRSFIVINLRRAGYDVIEAETGEDALERLKENPDTKVALLDIMLPGIDGFEVCRRMRAMDNKIGIIMLTARTQEMDKVTGLMTGADDYVTKPFSPAELTARVDALFRRAGGEEIPQTGEIRDGVAAADGLIVVDAHVGDGLLLRDGAGCGRNVPRLFRGGHPNRPGCFGFLLRRHAGGAADDPRARHGAESGGGGTDPRTGAPVLPRRAPERTTAVSIGRNRTF